MCYILILCISDSALLLYINLSFNNNNILLYDRSRTWRSSYFHIMYYCCCVGEGGQRICAQNRFDKIIIYAYAPIFPFTSLRFLENRFVAVLAKSYEKPPRHFVHNQSIVRPRQTASRQRFISSDIATSIIIIIKKILYLEVEQH